MRDIVAIGHMTLEKTNKQLFLTWLSAGPLSSRNTRRIVIDSVWAVRGLSKELFNDVHCPPHWLCAFSMSCFFFHLRRPRLAKKELDGFFLAVSWAGQRFIYTTEPEPLPELELHCTPGQFENETSALSIDYIWSCLTIAMHGLTTLLPMHP